MFTLLIICIIIGGFIAYNDKSKSALEESMKLFLGTLGCLGVIILIITVLLLFILLI